MSMGKCVYMMSCEILGKVEKWDLKSLGAQSLYEFKSRPGHHIKTNAVCWLHRSLLGATKGLFCF